MEYKLATEVSDEIIFDVWRKGYSDYLYKFEMEMPAFVSRFIENESVREYSYIAFDQGVPVGVILGNIKEYQGIRTMRCGGFAVIPTYRSKGIGKVLFEKHKTLAIENNCKQLYLEVLKENGRAIKFYEHAGYAPVYDYRFYEYKDVDLKSDMDVAVHEIDFDAIKAIRATMPEMHLFWQGEMFTLEHFTNVKNYCIMAQDEIIAALSMKDNGLINFIWVKKEKRLSGLAEKLLSHGLGEIEHNSLYAIASNNFVYEGFIKHLGFVLDMEQFEMMLSVK